MKLVWAAVIMLAALLDGIEVSAYSTKLSSTFCGILQGKSKLLYLARLIPRSEAKKEVKHKRNKTYCATCAP